MLLHSQQFCCFCTCVPANWARYTDSKSDYAHDNKIFNDIFLYLQSVVWSIITIEKSHSNEKYRIFSWAYCFPLNSVCCTCTETYLFNLQSDARTKSPAMRQWKSVLCCTNQCQTFLSYTHTAHNTATYGSVRSAHNWAQTRSKHILEINRIHAQFSPYSSTSEKWTMVTVTGSHVYGSNGNVIISRHFYTS